MPKTVSSLSPSSLFQAGPVLPVVVLERLDDALPLAEALIAGGIRTMEITLRTHAALESIETIRKHYDEMIVGAGTVTDDNSLQNSIESGAQFAISPGSTRDLLEVAQGCRIPFIPGVASPTEAMQAQAYGYQHLKLFPAEAIGGRALLQALQGPLPGLRFCPTGGINERNFAEYLSLANVDCVGGSWVVSRMLIKNKAWKTITSLCLAALKPYPNTPKQADEKTH